MNTRYNKYDEFNSNVINTCFPNNHSGISFKHFEECLANREDAIKTFGLDQANTIFKYCISSKKYIEENDEITPSELPKGIVKCVNCVVDKNSNCSSYLGEKRTVDKKGPSCNCDESRTRASRKKKKEQASKDENENEETKEGKNKNTNITLDTKFAPKKKQQRQVEQTQTSQKATVTKYPSYDIDIPQVQLTQPIKRTTNKKKTLNTQPKQSTVVFKKVRGKNN